MPFSSLSATANSAPLRPDGKGQVRLPVPMFRDNAWQIFTDVMTCEETFRVFWENDSGQAGKGNAVLTAWPHEPELLALGYALLEGCPADSGLRRKASVHTNADGSFLVRIGHCTDETPCKNSSNPLQGDGCRPAAPNTAQSAHAFASPEGDALPPHPCPPEKWEAPALLQAMDAFIRAKGMWDNTGCFHRAGVFCPKTNSLLTRAEDIGRHNCVDRLAGWSVVNHVSLADKALLISARLTESLCSKALRAGFRLLVSRSAVTTAAVAAAEQAGATLIGFARTKEQRFTVFTDPGRRVVPAGW